MIQILSWSLFKLILIDPDSTDFKPSIEDLKILVDI